MTKMMKAVVAEDGKPLSLQDVAIPAVGPSDVLVEVKAAGLNRADLIQRTGAYPPPPGASPIMGLEVAGVVTAVGADVSRWAVGDRVCALLAGGGYAEYASVDEGSLLPVPDGMDMVDACCFPEAMFTVWANVFDRVGLKSGEDFLCHGGTSGIGVMAIQMARVAGARTIHATAGSAEKCALATSLGADRAINYREEDFEEIVRAAGGAHVILDMVGGDYVQKNIGAARVDGRIVNIAYQNGFQVSVNFAPVLMKRLTLAATTLRARPVDEKRRIRDAVEKDFWPHVVSGRIRPVLDSRFAFADAEGAQAHMKAGGHSGKIILAR
jgi:putative PIG3 family NAD(P)H quinone oxidoreductase